MKLHEIPLGYNAHRHRPLAIVTHHHHRTHPLGGHALGNPQQRIGGRNGNHLWGHHFLHEAQPQQIGGLQHLPQGFVGEQPHQIPLPIHNGQMPDMVLLQHIDHRKKIGKA